MSSGGSARCQGQNCSAHGRQGPLSSRAHGGLRTGPEPPKGQAALLRAEGEVWGGGQHKWGPRAPHPGGSWMFSGWW